MSERAYPKPARYFGANDIDRPIFQGDVFRGAFGAFWRHPAAVRAQMAAGSAPDVPAYPSVPDLRDHVLLRGRGYGMLLPQPCEYSESEKGAKHPFRLVAPLSPLDNSADVDADRVRGGLVGHTVWVPRWMDCGPQDYYVDLRFTAAVDKLFLTRSTRVAVLSRPAWVALADRLSRYFVGVPLDTTAFALGQGPLHPESPANVGRR